MGLVSSIVMGGAAIVGGVVQAKSAKKATSLGSDGTVVDSSFERVLTFT